MPPRSLADAIEAAGSPVELLSNVRRPPHPFPQVPSEVTNWLEEQRSWRETCSLADQSHHMTDLWLAGPDARTLLSGLGVNDLSTFPVGRAKQFVACNPGGYLIGDGILFHLSEERFALVGEAPAANWVQYHAETGDDDVTVERDDNSGVRDGPPRHFRYQIQGPNALDVMAEAVDGPLPDLDFFAFDEVGVTGRPVTALRHGMSGEPGFEFWGPWADREAVTDAVLEAGAGHGLRRLGWKSYGTSGVVSGWLGYPLPAVYVDEALADYRRWLGAGGYEARFLLGGSFESEDITDYYLTPHALGYDRLISFDHDFVGRDALAELEGRSTRTKVTLVWNDADVVDAFGSLFSGGTPAKFARLPMPAWANQFDEVRADGETVGLSASPAYVYNERSMLSLGILDPEFAEPGTRVSVTWGEEDSSNIRVERHAEREIRATVASAPYTEDRR